MFSQPYYYTIQTERLLNLIFCLQMHMMFYNRIRAAKARQGQT